MSSSEPAAAAAASSPVSPPRAPRCRYCLLRQRHPLYVYLLSDRRHVNTPSKHSIVPYVGLCRNPLVKIHAVNRDDRRFIPASQLTKPGAGYYQVELVFGPLFHSGKEFKERCRRGSRKIQSRILFFCESARQVQREYQRRFQRIPSLYVRDKVLIDQLYKKHSTTD
jgi:hypothetical protein